jgi:ABC-2 type transport system ATP-binding protein
VTSTTDPTMSAPPTGAASGAISPAADAAIDVRDLRKRYGDVDAVDGVTFEVRKGEVFGLLGPNGAGKTTTVEILEGLRTPDAGTVRVLGLDVAKDADALKQRIGLALQTAALYPKLTVGELLDLFASFYRRTRPVSELLGLLDLTEKRNAQTKVLSGGQRQRLSVALALINEPELVFLDEPTTGLDPAARRALWDIIEAQKRDGRTVLLTTHYLEEAEILCDRVAIMDHGRILEMGTVDEVVARRFSERAVRFDTLDGLDDAGLATLPGVVRVSHDDAAVLLYTTDVPGTIGGLLALTDELGLEPANLAVRRPTLEDVFLALTGRALRD